MLRNTGGVESSKDLDQAGFEDCMAVIEDCGFAERGKPADYWRGKVRARGNSAGDRMVYRIQQLSAACKYPIVGMCQRFSEGRANHPGELTPREAWKLIEALKAIAGRAQAEQLILPF